MSAGSREKSFLLGGRRAFTLVELLTVIAIIAVLAAIIFPVYSRAKLAAYRSTDIANMNQLRAALQLYYADQGGYPPALLGYVNPYEDGPVNTANMVPADQVKSAIYPRRIDLLSLKPVMLKASYTDTLNAVWPAQDPRAVGTAPLLDLNGDGTVTAADDPAEARQAFGPTDGFVKVDRSQTTTDLDEAANFYKISGYDVAEVQLNETTRRNELRYTLFWTNWAFTGGNISDDPRQLGYSNPSENTVVTWNSSFRQYDRDGQPTIGRNDIVLFAGGSARTFDSRAMAERSWRVMP